MSALRGSSRASPSGSLCCEGYLTDGRRLFRVLSRFAAVGEDACASLEDCATLEVRAYTPEELCAMKLRPVAAAE